MAGIYIHIPFCRQICHYCDFHKSASLSSKNELLKALLKELELQKNYLGDESIETIYFGGGTPSVLTSGEALKIYDQISKFFAVNPETEITFEANPDDIDDSYIAQLAKTPVNRLSIGCQSFHDRDLIFLNRRHSAQQAQDSVKRAKNVGFKNISIDLIYGIPGMNIPDLETNVQIAL